MFDVVGYIVGSLDLTSKGSQKSNYFSKYDYKERPLLCVSETCQV